MQHELYQSICRADWGMLRVLVVIVIVVLRESLSSRPTGISCESEYFCSIMGCAMTLRSRMLGVCPHHGTHNIVQILNCSAPVHRARLQYYPSLSASSIQIVPADSSAGGRGVTRATTGFTSAERAALASNALGTKTGTFFLILHNSSERSVQPTELR
jgi:hypothetical protein